MSFGQVSRALVVAVILAVAGAFWLNYTELYLRTSTFAVATPVPLPAITALLLLLVVRGALSRLLGRWNSSREEILLVYCFLLISIPLASYGLAQQFIPHLTALFHYRGEGSELDLLIPYLPRWASPQDPAVIQGLYERSPEGVPWRAWMGPLCGWAILMLLIYAFCLCLSLLIENQWMQAERLRFPLVVPALELTAGRESTLLTKPILSDGVFWLAVGASVAFNGAQILHAVLPEFPVLNWMWAISFPQPPWNGIGTIYMYYRPVILGIAYLAPTSLSLSIWLFELLKYAQNFLSGLFGLSHLTGGSLTLWSVSKFPFHNEQALGAFAFVALFALWKARRHLFEIARSPFQSSASGQTQSYRLAGWGCALSAAGVVLWLGLSGFSTALLVAFLAVLLLITVTHCRIRAEAGPPLVWLGPYRPNDMFATVLGTRHFSPAELTHLGTFGFLTRGYFPFLMATQLESLKVCRESRIPRRIMVLALLVAVIVGMAAGLGSALHVWHKYGADRLGGWPVGSGRQSYESVLHYMRHSSDFNGLAASFIGVGFVAATLLTLFRASVWWWPLHPLGYAVAETWQSHHIWFMFFIAWAIKSVVIRYGGMSLFRRLVPFFFGLIVGQLLMAILAAILNSVWGLNVFISGS